MHGRSVLSPLWSLQTLSNMYIAHCDRFCAIRPFTYIVPSAANTTHPLIYPIFTKLNIKPSPHSPSKLCSFRRISSINLESFKLDLEASSLLTNPSTNHNVTNSPTDHNDQISLVCIGYKSILSELLKNTLQILLSSKFKQKIHGSILFFELSNHRAAV